MVIRTVTMPLLPGRAAATQRWLEQKAPGDLLPYFFDVSSWLAGDTIAGVVATVAPDGAGDVEIAAQGFTRAGLISVTLSGGNVGTDYAVTFAVTTAAGAVLVRTVWLYCQHLSPAPPAPPTVQALIPAIAANPGLAVVNGVLTLDLSSLQTSIVNVLPGWCWNNAWSLAQVPNALAGLATILLAQPTDAGAAGLCWSGDFLGFRPGGGLNPLSTWAASLPTADPGNGGVWRDYSFFARASGGPYAGADPYVAMLLSLGNTNLGTGTMLWSGSFLVKGRT